MKMNLVSLYIYLIHLIYIICKECTIDDFNKHLTECDSNNRRTILFYLKNKCLINNNIKAMPEIVENVECNKTCGEGTFLTFDQRKSELAC